ncbi:DUF5110 domain-containing protein [Aliikangiella marina]|uniref:DUF5110 domain-containing protein n=1 Tax=Aliikangiella marina TaxID=1712262 RepID=A0A545TCV6_9GAMM|nr:TIM-barrel domain-containing protein [Aliikangiella marina]TQV75039.1 DUF5110 domain-containing protein [Aliikangiella marina]
MVMQLIRQSQLLKLVGFIYLVLVLSACQSFLSENPYRYLSHEINDTALIITTPAGKVEYRTYANDTIEVVYPNQETQLPSFAKQPALQSNKPTVTVSEAEIQLINGDIRAVITKDNLSTLYYRDESLLTQQIAFAQDAEKLAFDFKLMNDEKIMGGGQRVLGMDRRGHRLPLYNKADYGYTTHSTQMYYSLPVVMSDRKYAIVFDNTASGYLDIGHSNSERLTLEAIGGRSSYIFIAGDSYPSLVSNYVEITGKQPMPPRWAFGNHASRFGYKTEAQVRETINKYLTEDFPVDSVIIDLYWFGPDIKGHMGNLDWDKEAFPTPQKMIADLKAKGVKTILITEPFILSTSKRWQDAVDHKVLAKDATGEPRRFDFYFGNTGLVDVFDENAQAWFWDIYQGLFAQGVAGTWGDLGEPEVHPDDSVHFISEIATQVRGDRVHNAYGHEWAKLVYEKQRQLQPNSRPFIMMRSGFAGSQRFGMIPWTGDVSRSWGGLKPQVELSLQMGMMGLAYTHSDLGGFAGGETFDKEMYIRWLQYGVFQPVYRPHAQDNIAPEPIFHDPETKAITREFIKLRYQLLPYNYTLAYENSTSGMPLMRPLMFEDESDESLFHEKSSYLWGDAFLVSPVTSAGVSEHTMRVPKGIWFDYWNGSRYQGGKNITVPTNLNILPVLVRAGSFIPMTDVVSTTEQYSSENLTLHYYFDDSVNQSSGQMYEDDGESFAAIANRAYDLLKFNAQNTNDYLDFDLKREGSGYPDMPESRQISLVIHNWKQSPESVSLQGLDLPQENIIYAAESDILTIKFDWSEKKLNLNIKKK